MKFLTITQRKRRQTIQPPVFEKIPPRVSYNHAFPEITSALPGFRKVAIRERNPGAIVCLRIAPALRGRWRIGGIGRRRWRAMVTEPDHTGVYVCVCHSGRRHDDRAILFVLKWVT